MKIRLDRSLPIALTQQIKSQIIYAVSTGRLATGTRLPSVRQLSAELQVAPVTVSQAYAELVHAGLVVTRAGAGTYVGDIAGSHLSHPSPLDDGSLHRLIDSTARQALTLGYAPAEVREAFLEYAGQLKGGARPPSIILVGNFRAVTEAYAHEMEKILSDLRVDVRPLLLAELRSSQPQLEETLAAATLVVAVPTRLQEVRMLLKPLGCRVVGVAFRLSAETRRQLAEIPAHQRVGVLATYPEFVQTMVDEVGSYCLAAMPPPYALLGQDDAICELLDQVDVLVYASGSEEVLDRVPARVQAIPLRHVPDADSVRRLRGFLV